MDLDLHGLDAAGLYRVSTFNQVKEEEEEDPIPAQQKAVHAYCEQKGCKLVKEYFETGVSAFKKSAFKRDAIHDVINDAKNGLFKILIVFKNNRLSRIESEYPSVLKELKKYGVIVWEVNRDKRLTPITHDEALMAYLDGWMAEGESRSISAQVRAGKRANAEQGKTNGSVPPFGFAIVGYAIAKPNNKSKAKAKAVRAIDPYEAQIINIIADMIEDGKGAKYIAKYLNEKNLFTRMNKLWTSPAVRRVIKNPAIAGISLMKINGDTAVPRNHEYKHLYDPAYYVHRDENGEYVINDDMVIIPFERWIRIMQIIEGRKKGEGVTNPNCKRKALLTGFLRCGYCDRSMSTINAAGNYRKKDGTYSIYDKSAYRCGSKALGIDCEGPSQVQFKKIDRVFLCELHDFMQSINSEVLPNDDPRFENDIILLKQEQQRLEREFQKVVIRRDKWLNELDEFFSRPDYVLSKESIMNKIKEQEDRLKSLHNLISEVKWKIDAKAAEKQNMKNLKRIIPNWYENFIDKPIEQQNDMLKHILDKVVYYKDHLEIHFKIDIDTLSADQSKQSQYLAVFKVASL